MERGKKMERGKWKEERGFHIEPRRGDILIAKYKLPQEG
jgi:hypothetical protein